MTAADLHACQWNDEQGLATRSHDSAAAAEADAAALVRAGVRRCVVFAVARAAVEGHLTSAGGVEGDARGGVALGSTDEMNGAQMGATAIGGNV